VTHDPRTLGALAAHVLEATGLPTGDVYVSFSIRPGAARITIQCRDLPAEKAAELADVLELTDRTDQTTPCSVGGPDNYWLSGKVTDDLDVEIQHAGPNPSAVAA
jgi:hypothetical protein